MLFFSFFFFKISIPQRWLESICFICNCSVSQVPAHLLQRNPVWQQTGRAAHLRSSLHLEWKAAYDDAVFCFVLFLHWWEFVCGLVILTAPPALSGYAQRILCFHATGCSAGWVSKALYRVRNIAHITITFCHSELLSSISIPSS